MIFLLAAAALLFQSDKPAATTTEKLANPQVRVSQTTLPPGAAESSPDPHPSVIVYTTDRPGRTLFLPARSAPIRNRGNQPLTFVRVDFLTHGHPGKWGNRGLSSSDKVLVDNAWTRTYEIRVPPGAIEASHTHKPRVMITLEGAKLDHTLPDGTHQTATVPTGEIGWRPEVTHQGHNIDTVPFHAVAIEPK